MQTGVGKAVAELTAERLGAALRGAREIYVSGCSAEIVELPEFLGPGSQGSTITGIFSPILNTRSYAEERLSRRCRTFFLNRELIRDLAAGWVDFCPWTYSEIAGWLRASRRFDAAIVMVSPPDRNGTCSFGTQADFLPDFYRNVPRLVGVINPHMPTTQGGNGINLKHFSAVFEYDRPLIEHRSSPPENDSVNGAIARNVAELIPNGATLQMGIGRIPQAVASALTGHRGLRIHSGLLDDSMLALEKAGALDRNVPIVAGVAIGTRELYDHVGRNPRFEFRPASYTHDVDVIALIPRFIAINAAIQVDLFGQVNSEGGDGRILASAGGLPDFLRGARRSAGGLSIITLRAGRGKKREGGIVPRICDPCIVTAPRYDVDVVVTENGVADLRDLSIDERAERLIAIADPIERDALQDSWRRIRNAAFPTG